MKGMKIFRQIAPYAGIVLLFAALAFGFAPELLSDKMISQSDYIGWTGSSKETKDYNAAHPDDKTMWSNSMFSGMPTTTFYGSWEGNLLGKINPLLDKARPGSYLLVSLIGAFLLMLAFGCNRWVAFTGAIAITFCAYNIQIIQAGHNTKMLAIAYMPWVLAAIVHAYKAQKTSSKILAAALFGIALSLQVQPNHPQITYYLAIMVFAYAITEFVMALKEKRLKGFFITSALLLVIGLCGIATVSNKLVPMFEYTKYTMRGGNGLDGESQEKGLDLEYATAWSYGINEMPNLMIPNFNGGSSNGALDTDSNTYRLLRENAVRNPESVIGNLPLYWGPQPFTVGPMYLGAVIIMLALLGLMISRDKRKWWLLAVSLFAILLAWGSHMMWFTRLMFDVLPFYNKFRTVSMALVILQITTPLLAVMGLSEFLKDSRRYLKPLYISAWITGGAALLVAVFPGIAGNFASAADSQYSQALAGALAADRMSLLRTDAMRTLILITATAAVLAIYCRKGAKYTGFAYGAIALLVIFDLLNVDKRYLNDSHFISKSEFNRYFKERPVDREIHMDKDLSYRVADLQTNIFNDSFTSYHHKSIGGYSAAKLSTYQNLIDYYLADELNSIYSTIRECSSIEEIQERLPYLPVLSMLNCRYIIVSGDYPPVRNNWALGNAWFVSKTVDASDARAALESLAYTDPRTTAVIKGHNNEYMQADSTESIVMTEYSPKRLKYRSNSSSERIAVFSEIYYPAGWRAYIDGKQTDILCADYLLRALEIPAGNHEITFEFEPDSMRKGALVSTISSSLSILILIAGIVLTILGRRKTPSPEV